MILINKSYKDEHNHNINNSQKLIMKNKSIWSYKAKLLAKELHNEISLNNNNWHKFRGNKKRRSAELIISALSQLINDGDELDIENLLNHAILWIKEEVKDKGCENH